MFHFHLSRRARLFLLLAFGFMTLATIGTACGSPTNTGANTGSVATSVSTSAATSTPAGHFHIGQVVQVSNIWQVTVLSAKTSTGSEFSKPASGSTYLVIDVSLKNISSQEQTVYGSVQFTFSDSTGQKYNETFTDFAKPAPNGKVEAGSPTRGELIYEVPKAMHQFTLGFEADITSSGQTIWDISV